MKKLYDYIEILRTKIILVLITSDYIQVELYNNDKILTLSTCYNDDDKIVVHAKMIKREIRQ